MAAWELGVGVGRLTGHSVGRLPVCVSVWSSVISFILTAGWASTTGGPGASFVFLVLLLSSAFLWWSNLLCPFWRTLLDGAFCHAQGGKQTNRTLSANECCLCLRRHSFHYMTGGPSSSVVNICFHVVLRRVLKREQISLGWVIVIPCSFRREMRKKHSRRPERKIISNHMVERSFPPPPVVPQFQKFFSRVLYTGCGNSTRVWKNEKEKKKKEKQLLLYKAHLPLSSCHSNKKWWSYFCTFQQNGICIPDWCKMNLAAGITAVLLLYVSKIGIRFERYSRLNQCSGSRSNYMHNWFAWTVSGFIVILTLGTCVNPEPINKQRNNMSSSKQNRPSWQVFAFETLIGRSS